MSEATWSLEPFVYLISWFFNSHTFKISYKMPKATQTLAMF